MQDKIEKLIAHVTHASNNNAGFIHRGWFVEHHLRIVERIASELCDAYPHADRDLVRVMAWMHDYGKILDRDGGYALTLTAGRSCLLDLGFPDAFVDQAISYIELVDRKEGLSSDATPIEVKIVSSADGASHLVGPFFFLWWYENANKPYKELMEDNQRKAAKDWDKKIVLPEVREAFRNRHDLLLEQTGSLPEKFF